MSKSGRWTQVEPARLFVGAEGGTVPAPQKSTWKTIAILAGITVAIYALSPGARYAYKHGHLPEPGPEHGE